MTLRLHITHVTRYSFDVPVPYGLQQLRKTPKSGRGQEILSWETRVEGGRKELSFEDHHHNTVELVSFERGTTALTVRCEGAVEMTETHGVIGAHRGPAPLWLFGRATPLTRVGPECRTLLKGLGDGPYLDRLHALSAVIRERVAYEIGATHAGSTVEQALAAGRGVCQDHAHIFVACARELGVPARYVSGYLMLDDRTTQEAAHAWAEAHLEGLGWVGFDVSNGISPDARYVRVATGLDYAEAAPVRGTTYGGAGEALSVEIEVAQQ